MPDSPAAPCRPPAEHDDKPFHWLRNDDVLRPAEWSSDLWFEIGYSGARTPEGVAEDGWSYYAPAIPPTAQDPAA